MNNEPRTYLDYNASAPMLDCARVAMVDALSHPGNASSVHFEGRNARRLIELARRQLGDLISCEAKQIVFTSGATEAANHVLVPQFLDGRNALNIDRLFVGATEHPCVLSGGRMTSDRIEVLPVLENGSLDLAQVETRLGEFHAQIDGVKALVAVQLANSETGVLQDIESVSEIVHRFGDLLVVDAVQALGKIPFEFENLGADYVFVSSHKIGGPQGVGALVMGPGAPKPMPLQTGGGQELGHRGGTENVAAISGFGAACEWHGERRGKSPMDSAIRDSIEHGLVTISRNAGNEVAQPVFFGNSDHRLPNTCCFSVPGIRAETALMALDLEGISISSGSACSSGKVSQSHVLKAMGASEKEMEGALRVSTGWDSKKDDADRFLSAWETVVGRMAA